MFDMTTMTDNLNKVIDCAGVGIFTSDFLSGEILYINSEAASYVDLTAEECIGEKCWEIFNLDGEGRCSYCQNITYNELIKASPIVRERYFPQKKMWVRITTKTIDWIGSQHAIVVSFHDITEMKNFQLQLAALAYIDQLLQLENVNKLEQDVRAANTKPSLIMFDILSLQKVNELYGREIGDELLRSIRNWVLEEDIPNSKLYRIGGDEFCLTIKDASPQELKSYADSIFYRFSEPWIFYLHARFYVFSNISIGVVHSDIIPNSEPLMNLIGRILKTAKDEGKVVVYDEQMDVEYKRLLKFEMSLKRCVRENLEGFDVYYQPIADPATGLWCGLEALCRWNSPELGPVTPSVFIPEAERLELIGTIGLWALKTAIRKCKEWHLDKNNKFILDVNVSALQFMDEMLAPKILKLLDEYDYPGEKLCLEITESTQFTFTDLSLQTIQALRSKNVLVALDDFGTGYSAFNKLQSLPIDIVKIERVFITNIENDSYQQYLFNAMAELAHAADMKLVAEGVENNEQVNLLLKGGADYLQGYLFSKPISPQDMPSNLRNFYHVDKAFDDIRNRKVKIEELLDTKSLLSPAMYKIMVQCMHILFSEKDVSKAITQVLTLTGSFLEASRSYVFLKDSEDVYSNTQEWCADGVTPQIEHLNHVPLPKSWKNTFLDDGIICTYDIYDLDNDVIETLADQGIKSIIAIPLWNDDDELIGFVGFDDCLYYRSWRPEEMLMLYNICIIITLIMDKQKLIDEVSLRDKIIINVLNRIEFPVYVSDIETGKILFANKHSCDIYGQELEGLTCWEALQGKQSKCDFCKLDKLMVMPDGHEYIWNNYNPIAKKHFQIHDSLLPWTSNKKAHLEYAIQIDPPLENVTES